MARYLIPATCLILVAGMFWFVRPKVQRLSNEQKLEDHSVAVSDQSFHREESVSSFRTKSKDRVIHRKPTLEETQDLLRNTILPRVEIHDQSVAQTANQLRSLIHEVGIEPHELTIICDPSNSISDLKTQELRLRNVPLAVTLKYICDSTKLRYRVTAGTVEFSSIFDDLPSDETLPQNEKETDHSNLPIDPDDPFQRPRSEDPDPFAKPKFPSS